MKHFLTFIMSCYIMAMNAQSTYEYLDINNIKTGVNSGGDLFNNLSSSAPTGFQVPNDSSNRSTIFWGNLWFSGIDDGGGLNLAANTYRQSGTDFWAGPKADNYVTVIQPGVFDSTYDNTYNKVWKLSKAEINNHIANYSNGGYTMPWSIANWPANGDTSRGEAHRLAPFADLNNNTVYEPQSGEYPLILGDQAVFFLINDARGQHTQSGGPKLNIEVYGMLYAYDGSSDSDLDNTIFLNYTIKNRSAFNYSNVKAGIWADFDSGCFLDDFTGSDSTLNAFFCYNGRDSDPDCGGSLGYGANLPAQGVVFLNSAMTSYMAYKNDFTVSGNPSSYYHFNNYMSAKWKDDSPAKDTCGFIVGSISPNTDFMFHDDPNDTSGISEYTCSSQFGNTDMKSIGTTGGLSLPAGGKLCIDIAFPVAFDSSAVNPHLKSVTKLKQRIQNIQTYYNQGLIGCPALALSVDEKIYSKDVSLKIYPNPASQMINIQTDDVQSSIKAVSIYDITGSAMHGSTLLTMTNATIDVINLPNGLYFLHVEMSNGQRVVRKVVKE